MTCLHSGIQDLELCLICSRPRYKVTAQKTTEITEQQKWREERELRLHF